MADDEQEVVKTAERLAELETPPTEEKPTQTETETSEKTEQTPEPKVEEESLPNDPKEAGKAFAEMRNRLKEQDARLKELSTPKEEVAEVTDFENYQAPMNFGVPPISTGLENTQFFNSDTGEFDAVGYQNFVIAEARKEANRAVEEQRQVAEAEAAYPELRNQKSAFYQATKGILLSGMVEGKKITAKQAADLAASLSSKEKQEIATQSEQKALADIAAKESASLEAGGNSGRSASAESAAEVEALRDASRGSSPEATRARAERLDKLT